MTSTTAPRHIEIDGQYFTQNAQGLLLDMCGRCGQGNGNISFYRHVQGGVCFECGGHGGSWVTVAEMTALVASRKADAERRAANRAKKAAAAERKAQRFAAANPTVAGLLDYDTAAALGDMIGLDMRNTLLRKGELTPKQVAFVERLIAEKANEAQVAAEKAAKKAAEQAAERPAPVGRHEVTGEIVYTDARPGYSYGSTSYVMIVKADGGFKVWATIPGSLFADGETVQSLKGRRVSLTITLEPKIGEPAFAFGKRPAKAQLLPA